MRRILVATLFLVFGTAAAGAAQQARLDPLLRALLRPDVRQTLEAAAAAEPRTPTEMPAVGGLLALDREGPGGELRVGVFVQLADPAALAELRAAGAEVGTVVGELATARVPVGALERLGRSARIARIESARLVPYENDVSIPLIRADRVRTRVGDAWQGFAGQGTIVAIYDTGIDYAHPDFRTPDDRTRLLGIWDQTGSGAPPQGFGYGYFCNAASLDDGSCPQRDRDGHGTHVAGSAAGDGSATGSGGTPYRFAGVAPAANLLVVKGGDTGFAEDRIVDGIDWVFREAARYGMPAVVNLSLGSQFGPHDGTRLYERMIDALSGPGRIVVAAAGNNGANANESPPTPAVRRLIHGMGQPAAGVQEFRIVVPEYQPRSGARTNFVRLNLWYAGADRLTLSVVRPDGSSVSVAYGGEQLEHSAAGGVYIDNASGGPNPQNGDNEAFVLIENFSGSGPPATGEWLLRVTPVAAASGRPYHFWIWDTSMGAHGTQGFTNSHVVSSPGTARRTLTVGAYVSKVAWQAADGNTYQLSFQEPLGDIAYFSSGGPTRDDRRKPEIAAPGRVIFSSLSADAPRPPPSNLAPGGVHRVSQGTSMAAPHVAGAVALLLQRAPSLTPENVREILAASAIRDEFTQRSYVTGDPGGTPNFQWGWGKLNVEAALEATAPFARVSALVVTATALPVPAAPSAERGTRVPLLRLTLQADGPEAIDVTQLGFDVAGHDPGATLLLFHDADGDGQLGPGDPALGSAPAPLRDGDTTRVLVPLGLRVPAGQAVAVLVALELSGAAPHRAPIQAWFVPEATRAVGVDTGQPSPLRQPTAAVAANVIRPSVLRPGERFALSENPVRSGQVIFNFAERPTLAEIYTASGRRVADLLRRMEPGEPPRVVWDLTNDRGAAIAPGVYLAVFRIAGETVREKLIVVRAAGGGGE